MKVGYLPLILETYALHVETRHLVDPLNTAQRSF